MTQDELKQAVAREAIKYVVDDTWIGVGSGTTANFFIDELGKIRNRIKGAVSSSEKSSARLKSHGIEVEQLNNVDNVPVYIDGADEVTKWGAMIKGGGGALTREKIVAAVGRKFVCIVDQSKVVDVLGRFPLPVEVIPMATRRLIRQFAAMGGSALLRLKDGKPLVTDNGQHILDVTGLKITDPLAFETQVSQWPGVVTVGVFAFQKAHVCLLGAPGGVKTLVF